METIQLLGNEIKIFEDPTYTLYSADNKTKYDIEFVERDSGISKIGVQVLDGAGNVSKGAIFVGSAGATGVHPDCYIVDDDNLILSICDYLYSVKLPGLILNWKTKADFATCFSVYSSPNAGYIVHGELQISHVDKAGEISWSYSASEPFTRVESNSQDFRIDGDSIFVFDWENNLHQISVKNEQGEVIKKP